MANWSPDRQQAVQARCEKATTGPWKVCCPSRGAHVVVDADATHAGGYDIPTGEADADFIARARQDLPDALELIARQQADLTRLAEVGKALEMFREWLRVKSCEGAEVDANGDPCDQFWQFRQCFNEALNKLDDMSAHPIQCPVDLSSIDAISHRIVQRVAELSDRTSPDDWPEAMLVTSAELRAIVFDVIGSLLEPKDAKEAARE